MKEYVVDVRGMSCSSCERRVIEALKRLYGVNDVRADYRRNEVVITADSIDERDVKQAIEKLGYTVYRFM